jgi:hypothetical protein
VIEPCLPEGIIDLAELRPRCLAQILIVDEH